MTDRTITLTPAEAEKFTALAVGESMWIVRTAVHPDRRSANIGDAFDEVLQRRLNGPPVELVQACAPCETCGGSRCAVPPDCDCDRVTSLNYALCTHLPADCPDCRIELVGPCPEPIHLDHTGCTGTVTLGYAYAIGQPLPIIRGWARPDGDSSGDVLSFWPGHYGPACVMQRAWNATAIQTQYADRTAALAHYGDPSALVGRWALELAVTQ